MALRRDSRGQVTSEQFTSDKQAKAKDLWNQRANDTNKIREQNRIERSKRSAKDQLAKLDRQLGKGIGARKERAKLSLLIGLDQAKKGQFVSDPRKGN